MAQAQAIEIPGSSERGEGGRRAGALRIVGLIALVAWFVAGLWVSALRGWTLVAFAPFAAVGAFLVVRRPRQSIGWILCGIAVGFLVAPAGVDVTAAQLEAGTIPLLSAIANATQFAGLPLVVLLLGLLAFVFPSGALPGGRVGSLVRALTWVGLAITVAAVFAPTISVNVVGQDASVRVPNPLAVLPSLPLWSVFASDAVFLPFLAFLGGAAVSLMVRFRRATGIERLQLRWIGAAVGAVAVAIPFGFVVGTLVPSAGFLAWVGVIVAFPMVPIAVGVAVIRYRLYEIDTIINRAIVYVLLTAILAGASAASIGLGQRLFAGVFGQGSDATIIVTTLLVVTAFTPVKNSLQSIVDRRFKEVHSPALALEAFATDVQRSFSVPDAARTLPRFLDAAMAAYHAGGGEVSFVAGHAIESRTQAGGIGGEPSLRAAATRGSVRATIALYGGDVSSEGEALQPALASVLAEVTAGA